MAASAAPSDALLLSARPRALFRTRSRDEAVESVERLYGPHTLELKSRGALDMRLSGLDVGTLNLSSIEYGCPATAHTPLPHDHWVFSTCLRGEIMVGPHCARAGYSIRVNSVHPGYIWTPMVETFLKSLGDVEEGRKALDSLHPIGHIGEPDDIAYGVLYLASDESKFVTGTELVIDGGYTAQ